MARLHVGTAGWSYADWRGPVYPHKPAREFDPLRFLAGFVDTVEINTSFYGPPAPTTTERWVAAVAGADRPGREPFRFTAKLYRGFTHLTPKEWDPEEVRAFLAGMEPLRESGRLGAVLAQFPLHFVARRDNIEHLEAVAATFAGLPLVLEVRHRTFESPHVLEHVAQLGFSLCNIDQPQSRATLAPAARVIGRVGYFRLHGRNARAWFSRSAGRDEKYDYLYTPHELREFVPLIRRLEERADDVYVIANNHFCGKAVANALELQALLTGQRVHAPPALLDAYPQLQAVADPREVA